MTASSVDFDGTGTVAYSETDSSNSGASPGNFPDSTAPSNVKLIGRAHMGAGQRWYDRDHAVSGGTVGGTGNAITLAYTVAPNAYAQGQRFCFKATAANSGATTLNVNSLGAKNVFKRGTSGVVACTGGEIESGDIVICDYDGTQMQLISQAANAAAAVGVSSIADATNGGLSFSASTGSVTAKLQPSDLATKSSPTTADSVVIMDAAASNVAKTSTVAQLFAAYTSVAQIVNTETGAVATGTTSYTQNDSIPTNTNGDQYMSLAITPTNSSSILIIDVIFIGTVNSAGVLWVGLFQDTTSAALASALTDITTSGNYRIITLRHKMTAGTTSSTTFKARAGLNGAATTTFNGLAGSRQLGGSLASSITITEYLP